LSAILYSFRRCPYAMRARLALIASGESVELREVSLRAKPPEMLAASPKATVPVLVTPEGVIDESLQIMLWALTRSDSQGWLDMPPEGHGWITRADTEFKAALDGVKYASRYPAPAAEAHLQTAHRFLTDLNAQLSDWLFAKPSLADFALLPFIRQFAAVDPAGFATQPWPRLHDWLNRFLASDAFATAMQKHPLWQPEDPPRLFP
jgi:glutathione S-transferase